MALPDAPSIVVLPFVNLSSDPEQEYFSDGITEDLTSRLSKLAGLAVISRNSAFTYKGKAVKVQEVSRELGVAFLAGTYRVEWNNRWSQDPQVLERAFELAQQALALDDTQSTAYMVLSTWTEILDVLRKGLPLLLLGMTEHKCAKKYVRVLRLELLGETAD